MPIRAALRKRYSAPGWAVFEEIPNVTGFDSDRRADALALGVWPSHGFAFHGFEIKSARADWLRELRDPTKSDAFSKYCDRWWLLAEPKVALESEIPESWGWMESTKSGLRVRKDAPRLTPEPIPRSLMASMMRSVEKTMVPKSLLSKEREEMKAELERKRVHADVGWDRGTAERQISQHEQMVRDFNERTGIDFATWRPEVTIEQVKLILRAEAARKSLNQKASWALDCAKEMRKLADKIIDDTKEP